MVRSLVLELLLKAFDFGEQQQAGCIAQRARCRPNQRTHLFLHLLVVLPEAKGHLGRPGRSPVWRWDGCFSCLLFGFHL
jgi:hypothetical protein